MFYLEPIQTCKMGFSGENSQRLPTINYIFAKNSILDVWLGSKYVSACLSHLHFYLYNVVSLLYLQIPVPGFCTCLTYLEFCLYKSNHMHNQTAKYVSYNTTELIF